MAEVVATKDAEVNDMKTKYEENKKELDHFKKDFKRKMAELKDREAELEAKYSHLINADEDGTNEKTQEDEEEEGD